MLRQPWSPAIALFLKAKHQERSWNNSVFTKSPFTVLLTRCHDKLFYIENWIKTLEYISFLYAVYGFKQDTYLSLLGIPQFAFKTM